MVIKSVNICITGYLFYKETISQLLHSLIFFLRKCEESRTSATTESKCWMLNYPLCLSENYPCALLESGISVSISVQGTQTHKCEVARCRSC